jgi:dienelactone hydrolase
MRASDPGAATQATVVLRRARAIGAAKVRFVHAMTVAACLALGACAAGPLVPFSTDTPPLVLAPAHLAGVHDKRARFREIYCAVLEANGRTLPDYRPCDDALARVGHEPSGTGKPVELSRSKRGLVAAVVFGIGYECFERWLEPPGSVAAHVRQHGFDAVVLRVDALSGTERNARRIRDAVMAMQPDAGTPRVVLIGYSKGAPDILEAVVAYPEIRSRVAAVVSAAGAIGGSPLANDAQQYQADLLRHFPGASCGSGDGGAVSSLRPATRHAWLAKHPLPGGVRYYSLATFPRPEHISSILQASYDKLARIDTRNDSQVIFYDQIVPGSTLVGYLDADHWAVAVPISRAHPLTTSLFVTRNAYPREALMEALLRFLEEDLATPP